MLYKCLVNNTIILLFQSPAMVDLFHVGGKQGWYYRPELETPAWRSCGCAGRPEGLRDRLLLENTGKVNIAPRASLTSHALKTQLLGLSNKYSDGIGA